jgi:2-oxoacid:acceptor oxidoreductase delta subunit (pyruvate/2-ketoisovalerate family)
LRNGERAYGPFPGRSYTYKELPIGSTSIGIHDDVIRTGLWRLLRPVIKLKRPPCSQSCPAGVDIRGVISLVQKGLFEEAHSLYVEENPFPALCGRVCFHPCENACNRKEWDEAVAINTIERFLADFSPPAQPPNPVSGRRVAIVGSGPAGLSCAHFLRLLGHPVTVFESRQTIGGLLRSAIPSYRLPKEVIDREVRRLEYLGIEFRTAQTITADTWIRLEPFGAVFCAPGSGRNRDLPLAGSESSEIISALEFLDAVNLGRSVNLGSIVAVIGGGNAAIDAARTALRLGSKPILIYRRSMEEMPAFGNEVTDALEEGVDILYLTSPVRVTKLGPRQRIECIRNRLGEPDEDGRRRPIPIEGSSFHIEADSVIAAVGELPDLTVLPQTFRAKGSYLPVDEFGRTEHPGVFAGGDITDQPHTVAHAIGSGKRAALAIDCFLKGRQPGEHLPVPGTRSGSSVSFRDYKEGTLHAAEGTVAAFSDLNPAYFTHVERTMRPKLPVEARSGFEEVYGSLLPEEAVEEASRCLSCGQCCRCDNCAVFCPDGSVQGEKTNPFDRINYDYCKGCGICENECPVGAIDMEREE